MTTLARLGEEEHSCLRVMGGALTVRVVNNKISLGTAVLVARGSKSNRHTYAFDTLFHERLDLSVRNGVSRRTGGVRVRTGQSSARI